MSDNGKWNPKDKRGGINVQTIWQNLTQPHLEIQTTEAHRRYKVLPGILLLIVLILSIMIVQQIFFPDMDEPESDNFRTLFVSVIAELLFIGTYGLSRTRHTQAAAFITTGLALAGLFGLITADPNNPLYLVFPIGAVILGSILLSTSSTFLVALLCMIGYVLARQFLPLDLDFYDDAVRIFIGLALGLLVATKLREDDLKQIGQQAQQLTKNEEQLHSLIEQLQQRGGELEGQTQELDRSNVLLAALSKVASRLPVSESAEDILEILQESLRSEHLGFTIELYDALNGTLRIHSHSIDSSVLGLVEKTLGMRVQDMSISADDSAMQSLLENGQVLFLKNPVKEIPEMSLGLPKAIVRQVAQLALGKPGMRIAFLPLRVKGQSFGILVIWGVALRDKDLQTMQAFASQVSIALENSQLLAEVRANLLQIDKRAQTMTTLYQTTLDLIQEHNLSNLLNIIVERAAKLLEADGGCLYLCEPDQGQVRCVVSYNMKEDYTGTILKYGEGVAGTVAQTGQPLIINEYHKWEGRAKIYGKNKPFQKVLSLPITWLGNVIGVLQVLGHQREKDFNEEDLQLAMLFVNQASAVIQNARLLEQVQSHASNLEVRVAERTAELENLQRLTEKLLSTENLEQIQTTIVEGIATLLDFSTVTVAMYDENESCFMPATVYPSLHDRAKKLPGVKDLLASKLPYRPGQNRLMDKLMQDHQEIVTNSLADFLDSVLPRQVADIGQKMMHVQSYIGLPLTNNNRTIGLLLVSSSREKISPREREALELITGQLSIAISRARHYQLAQERAINLESLRQITEKLLSTEDLLDIQRTATERVTKLLDLNLAIMGIYHVDRQGFSTPDLTTDMPENIRRLLGIANDDEFLFPYTLGKNAFIDQLLQDRQVFVTHSFSDLVKPFLPKVVGDTIQAFYKTKTYMGLPLIAENQTIGLLLVGTSHSNIQTAERSTLELIAGQLAVAISRARHYQAAQARAVELAQTLKQMEREIEERKEAEKRLTASLKEKEVLLREVYHRVKNNLQVIGSLLNLQSASIRDAAVREEFKQTRSRINAMALVHEKLYQSPNLARINFSEYVQALSRSLISAYAGQPAKVRLDLQLEPVWLGLDTAIPCGLMLNELVANSLEHAFPADRHTSDPLITVKMECSETEQYRLTVSDNGIGLPVGFDWRNTESLGLQLINILTSQLGGEVQLNNEHGAAFAINFSELSYKDRR